MTVDKTPLHEHKDFILFSTADWDEPYWTNKQHTASHLAAAGHRVLYIESVGLRTPNLASGRDLGRMWRRLKRSLRGPRRVRDSVWVYSPLIIPFKHQWSLVRFVNQGILRTTISLFAACKKFQRPVIWTYHPFMLESLPKLDNRALVYHCVDDLSVIPGIDPEGYRLEEARLLSESDVVFATSQALYDHCSHLNTNTHFFPNVADLEHFSSAQLEGSVPQDLANIPEPRLGYIGVLSDFKVDFDLVYEVAKTKPEWQWVFVGEEREGQSNSVVEQLRPLANVHFLGRRDYNQLPEYMRGLSLGMLPSVINQYTRSMFPMKYFEYLAAGLPVVATALDFTNTYTAGMRVASNSDEMILAIEKQLQRGRYNQRESRVFVGENTWDQRLKKMLSYI